RRLDSFARAVRQIQVTNTFGRQQPLVTGTGRDVHQFSFYIEWHYAERLDRIHDQQRTALPRGASEPLEVRAKTRRKLHVANRHYPRVLIDETLQLVEIDAAVSFFAHPHFNAERIPHAQPGINV